MCKEQTNQKPDAVGVAVEPEVRLAEQIVNCTGNWIETTKRKGKHKICRDMFVVKTRERFVLGIVKNGNLVLQRPLTTEEKTRIVRHYQLEYVPNRTFNNAGTYRTPQSNNFVKWLLDIYEQQLYA